MTNPFSSILIIFYIFIVVLFSVPSIAIFWKLYVKAGKPGWAAVIPGYNNIVMNEIAGKAKVLGIIAAVGSVSGYVSFFLKSPIITLIGVVYFFVYLYILNSFIKQYDRGIGSWIVYLFLPIIGFFIVDKANYKGTLPTAPGVGGVSGSQSMNAPGATPAFVPPTNPMPPAATQQFTPQPMPAPSAPQAPVYGQPSQPQPTTQPIQPQPVQPPQPPTTPPQQ